VIIDQPNFVQYKWNLIDTALLDYNGPILLYDKKIHYTKLVRLTARGPCMTRLHNAALAIFGPPGICKWERMRCTSIVFLQIIKRCPFVQLPAKSCVAH